ncbi:flotillin-like protein 2 [Aegilops tauschii subsp. strangulata]|uniref:flotillin-like protein 2 n=1 Tax=Aegilops tauschii subsp. strangulata TaxID=200361 RepID=UPI00098BB0E5|nr:flotillin-like protein 2 [Aegilops tauschii subsp. strangulata]
MLVAQLTMDEIFTCTKKFKQGVFSSVQKELDQFSLFIYNATVKQLVDVPGHEYFSYLGEKTQQEAASRAQVDNAAKVDAKNKVLSVRQQGEALKEKAKVKAEAKVAEVEAAKAVAIRDAELQMEVKTKNVLCQTDKLKVEQLSKSTVHYDTQVGSRIEHANTLFYRWQKAADTTLYKEMKAAVR